MKTISIAVLISVWLIKSFSTAPGSDDNPVYLDPEASVDDRVEDLLSRMTLEEKVGQMNQLDLGLINTGGGQGDVNLDLEKAREFVLEHNTGSFINGEAVPPQHWYEFIRDLSRIAVEESRLGIPIIYGIDHVHGGSYMSETTIFPHAINLGATFNPENSYNTGWVTAHETADVGHHWNFAPTLDLGVNPHWSRLYETYGEDPHLVSEMGRAYLEGYTGNEEILPYRLASNAKHFIAYSDPVSGWDKTPVQIGMQELFEMHLPPFRAAVDAGLKTIMVNSSDVNGTPAHASRKLLTDILRDMLGFEGVILTDWDEIGKLRDFHRTAGSYNDAIIQVLDAGVDMSMTPLSLNFYDGLIELVQEGKVSEERIDESVRRILRVKFEIGLFENPFPRNDRFDRIGSEENRERNLQAARESMVLLKNEGDVLPASNPSRVVLAGPSADSKRNLAGGWTLAWQGGDESRYPEDMHTIYSALQQTWPDADIMLLENAEDASEELNNADLIIYAGGEEPYAEFVGNITDLKLPQEQRSEIEYLSGAEAPLALVLVQGRPRIITDVIDGVDAFVHAGLPGFEGAVAIADVLSGAVNPSGRLPVSYPRYTGHSHNYNHKPSDLYFYHPDNQDPYNEPYHKTVLYTFGDGLSYTTFSYSDIELSSDEVSKNGSITASVTVTNDGDMDGRHTVLWFTTQRAGIVARPVRELKHFENIFLEAGASKTVEFEISPSEILWYPDSEGQRILEAGEFQLRTGDDVVEFSVVE